MRRSKVSPGLALVLEPGPVVIGAPSLGLGVASSMLYVGSAAGVIYAVEVPF